MQISLNINYEKGKNILPEAVGIPVEEYKITWDKMVEGKTEFGVDALIEYFELTDSSEDTKLSDAMKFLMLFDIATKIGESTYAQRQFQAQQEARMRALAENNPEFFKQV